MKTSLNELRLIEDYLFLEQNGEDNFLFEARLLLQPKLKEDVCWQQKTYLMVKDYGRLQLRKEIEKVQQTLFTVSEHQSFRQRIMRIFNK